MSLHHRSLSVPRSPIFMEELEARRQALLDRANAGELVDQAEIDAVTSEIEEFNRRQVAIEEQRARLLGSTVARPAPIVVNNAAVVTEEAPLDRRSITEAFVSSDGIRDYREHGINQRNQGVTHQAGETFDGVEMRALITTTTVDPLTPTQRIPGIIPLVEDRRLAISDLIPTIPVNGNAVEYVRDNSSSPIGAAAEVAEGTEKPEATYTWELITDTIKTVAHWTDISRQALEDEAQLRGLVRDRLFYGLAYRVDGQILNGTGSSGTIKGILNYSEINAYDVGASNTEAKVVSVRKAKTLVQVDEFSANIVVLNPVDWETIELSTDDTGRWRVSPNVQDNLTPRIWGMTVVESNTIAAGTALLGDFRLGAAIYDRRRASLYVTDSDASKFRSNILTLLAELRLNLAMYRPSAFCKVTFRGAE